MQPGDDDLLTEVSAVSIKPSELVRQVLQSGRDEIAYHTQHARPPLHCLRRANQSVAEGPTFHSGHGSPCPAKGLVATRFALLATVSLSLPGRLKSANLKKRQAEAHR